MSSQSKGRDKQLKDTSQAETKKQKVKNEALTRWENYQQIIQNLRVDKKATSEFKRVLINLIYRKVFPDRHRTIVEIENWEDKPPFRIRIDSKNKGCNDCKRKSHYIVYNIRGLPTFGWRLCWEHLDSRARAMLEKYYWNYKI